MTNQRNDVIGSIRLQDLALSVLLFVLAMFVGIGTAGALLYCWRFIVEL